MNRDKKPIRETLKVWRAASAIMIAAALCGCESKLRSYDGPEVTRIVVMKNNRRMQLMHDSTVLSEYEIDLGYAPEGPKRFRGDGRTPEGRYYIDRKNPVSEFHLSLGISYPNARDVARARAAGRDPGDNIFIHGARRSLFNFAGPDWTIGCISVSNREMEDIYAMVKKGTIIDIYP